MEKDLTDNRDQKNDTVSGEKTNQDYNKQTPNPKDPNQNKNHPIGDDRNKSVGKPSYKNDVNEEREQKSDSKRENFNKGRM